MPVLKRYKYGGRWVPVEQDPEARDIATVTSRLSLEERRKRSKKGKVFRVETVWGRQLREWLDSNLWQPLQETVIPAEAKAPLTVVYFGTYGSDGMRRDGSPAGAYSSIYDQYAMQGRDVYTRDEAKRLKQWDTRKPFPGFDPKLGSKTLDIYSED
jgi:hypothetical protein